MEHLRYLHIVDVRLSSSASHPVPIVDPPHPQYVNDFALYDLVDFEPVAEMIEMMGCVFEFTLTRCALGRPADFGVGGYLTLEEIDENEDMVPLLCAWQGERLSVTKCPGFTDRVLDAMGARVDGTGVSACARGLTRLHIANCPNFTIAALRRLVAGLFPHQGIHFEAVHLTGCASRLSIEDFLWFTRNVEEFQCEGVDVSEILERLS
jgi:hypothetical protein